MRVCKDMRQSGCTLAEILKAGQWRSSAVMTYLNEAGLGEVRQLAPSGNACADALRQHCLQDMAFEVAIHEDEEWID